MNKLTFVTLLSTAILIAPRPVIADGCTTQYGGYGGGTNCNPNDLTLDKEVRNPTTGVFVQNLTENDAAYAPGSEVLYRLTIKNVSGQTFNPVTVTDYFPSYMTFVSGPGAYDPKANALTFKLENVIAGETRTVEVLAKMTSDMSKFPKGSDGKTLPLICDIENKAHVSAPPVRPEGQWDSARLCVRTNLPGVTQLPKAGFNDILIVLPFIGTGLGGLALTMQSKFKKNGLSFRT